MVRSRRFATAMALLTAALAIAVMLGVSAGTSGFDVAGALRALSGGADEKSAAIVAYRAARVALAAIVGASLAGAGVALQALLRNPLADPYILGVSGGGALGAALYITLGSSTLAAFGAQASEWGLSGLAFAAFTGSLIASAAVLFGGRRAGHVMPGTLLLVGVMVNALSGAAVLTLTYMTNIAQSHSIVTWLMGNLGTLALSVRALIAAGGALVTLTFLLWRLGARLNLMTLGDESAKALGVNVARTRLEAFALSALVTGLSVALAGPIGFVGLVVPHAARAMVGADHRHLFPAAAVAGAAFLVLADAAARSIRPGVELPVGILTAAIGAPAFIWILRSRRGRYFE